MHGFENNVALLTQWDELHPGVPLPASWSKFVQANTNAAIDTANRAPWVVQLLDGTAPAGLRAAALQGNLPTIEGHQQQLQQQAAAQEAEYQRQEAGLQEKFEAQRRARMGDRRFEAEQQAELQRQQRLQQQQEQTREFEKNLAQRAFR